LEIPDPHPWLGLDYRELLPGLALGQHRFTMSLTRPNGFCHGSGALRVVSVRQQEAACHCVLAYEHYIVSKPRPARGTVGAQ
jgi:hypothetical protein